MARVALVTALALPFLAVGGTYLRAEAAPAGSSHQAPPTGTDARPSLRLAGLAPFAVAGRGFEASERVRISAGKVRKTLTAGRRGRFVAGFGRIDLCGDVVVIAVGTKGSRARLAFDQLERVHCLEP